MKPTVVFVTGITGTGKTTVCQKLAELFEEKAHLSSLIINDYPLLLEWTKLHKGNDRLARSIRMQNGEIVESVVPSAYRVLSLDLAVKIAEKIKAKQASAQLFFIEAARGAGIGDATDYYGEHHFKPIMAALGGGYHYCNIELRVEPTDGDFSVLKKRVDERWLHDFTVAPWLVCQRYIRADGLPIRSHEDAQKLGMPSTVINNHVDGHSGLSLDVVAQLSAIAEKVLAAASAG